MACFLVAPESRNTQALPCPLKHRDRIPHTHHKRLPELLESLAQICKRFSAKGPLPGGSIGLTPKLRLNDVEGKHWPLLQSLKQGPVINRAEITLEPDQLEGPVVIRHQP